MARLQSGAGQPYTNMHARKGVLITGFTFSILSFALVLTGCLLLFVPSLNIAANASPSILLKWLLIIGVSAAFIATVFTVSGANTLKPIAHLSMFLSTVSFITGAALLVIILLFRTILPLDALARLA